MTGGAGYVGSVSAEALLAAGHEVVVLDDLTTGHRAAVPAGAPLHHRHIRRRRRAGPPARVRADRGRSSIARRGRWSASRSRDPSTYYRDNVAGGVALLEAARAAQVERLVFSSTAAVYGIPDVTPIPEDAPLRPINPYGESKRAFESALAWYGRAYGLRSVTLRYFNVAGATEALGEDHDPETHLIPNVLRAAEGGRELTIFGDDYPTPDGTCIRDYIHVADLADAHLRAIEATAPGDPRTDDALVCNLGNGGGFSVREVLAAAEAVVGRPIPFDRRAASRRVIHRSSSPRRPGGRGPRLAAGPPEPRGDGRLGLGLATERTRAATRTERGSSGPAGRRQRARAGPPDPSPVAGPPRPTRPSRRGPARPATGRSASSPAG